MRLRSATPRCAPPAAGQRGFTLLSVMLALVLVLTVLLTTLRDSNEALTAGVFHRDRELMNAAVDTGVAAGIAELTRVDGSFLLHLGDVDDAAAPMSIFDNWGSTALVENLTYPPAGSTVGEMSNLFNIRVGAVRGQRVRPPPGEDVRSSHGAIVHLQISVRADRPGSATTEQRYEVGVRVPEPGSYQ